MPSGGGGHRIIAALASPVLFRQVLHSDPEAAHCAGFLAYSKQDGTRLGIAVPAPQKSRGISGCRWASPSLAVEACARPCPRRA